MRRMLELLDNPVEWTVTDKWSEEIKVEFKVGEIFYFVLISIIGSSNLWDIEFGIDDRTPASSKYGITDTGNASIVFSTVIVQDIDSGEIDTINAEGTTTSPTGDEIVSDISVTKP